MNIKIEGAREVQLKLSNFSNFMLPKEYNKAMLKVGKYGTDRFRKNILERKSKSGERSRPFKDLNEKYKKIKKKKWGYEYPILFASGKMFGAIKYYTGQSWRKFQNSRMVMKWGFKTSRSERIASYHVNGLRTSTGRVVRNPFFFTTGDKKWVYRTMYQATVTALRKARLKRS